MRREMRRGGLHRAFRILLCALLVTVQVFLLSAAGAQELPVAGEQFFGDEAALVGSPDLAQELVPQQDVPAQEELPAPPQEPALPEEAIPTEQLPPPAPPSGWTRTDDTPMDVREVMAAVYGPDTSIVTELSLRFWSNGEPVDLPGQDAQVELTINIELPGDVPAQLRRDDWYIIDLPATLVPVQAHIIGLSYEDREYARVELETNPLRIKFTDEVTGLYDVRDSITVQAAFAPDAYAPGQTVTLSLPGENAPGVSFTMAGTPGFGEEPLDVDKLIYEILDTNQDDAPLPEDDDTLDAEKLIEGILDLQEGDTVDAPGEGADVGTGEEIRVPQSLQGQGLVTDFSVRLPAEADPAELPSIDAQAEVTLGLMLSDALAAQIVQGTTYAIALPQALAVEQPQAADAVSAEGIAMASAQIGPGKSVVLTFDQQGADLPRAGSLVFMAAFDETAISTGTFTLSLPDEAMAPTVDITLDLAQPAPEAGGDGWHREDDTPMNIKDILALLGIDPPTILGDINLTYQEPGGGEASSTDASINASIDFNMEILLSSDVTANLREGDTYAIDLPAGIMVTNGDTYELYGPDGSGTSYATVKVNKNGRIEITFHDAIRTLGDAEGSFHFSASFDQSVINRPGDHVVHIPNEPDDKSVTVNIHSNQEQAVDKKGVLDTQYNAKSVTWTVDFNKPAETLNGAVLSDPMPDGMTLTGTQVYTVDVDLDGNVIAGSERPLDASAYTIDADGTVRFTGPVSKAIRVVYTADITGDITEGGSISFTNTATLTTSDNDPLTGSATVTGRYGRFLDKRNTSYDPVSQRFGWEVRYNYGQQSISQSDATLTDTLNGQGMVYDQDSLVIRYVNIDKNGNPALGDIMDPSLYTVEFNGAEMKIVFKQDLNQAVNITYTTHIEGIVDNSGEAYGNSVSTSWGDSTHATGSTKPTEQQNVIKSLQNVQEVNRVLVWTVRINRSHYHMIGWSMTDTMGQGLYLEQENLIAMRDLSLNRTMMLNTDYSVEISGDKKTLTIRLLGQYAQGTDSEMELLYYTRYDDTAPQIVTNRVTNDWTDEDGGRHNSTSDGQYPRTPMDVDNGSKYGSYNAVTKEITWAILVNYHELTFRPATLTDQIKSDQQYIHDSLSIYQYWEGTPENIGTEIPIGALGVTVEEPSGLNNQTLRVAFPGADDNQTMALWVIFKTSLEGQMVNESGEYDNDAVFSANGHDYQLHGTVSIANGGSLVDKDGKQSDDGYVHWSATINPSQSTLESPTITDTPSENQHIDMESLAIYATDVDEKGNIEPMYSQPLTNEEDYTAKYEKNADDVWVLTIQFNSTISTAYVLQYRANVYMTEQTGVVSNNIHLEGKNGGVEHSDKDDEQLYVRVHEGGGTIYGMPGSVRIRKLGGNGGPLAGAVLVLEDMRGNRIGPVTVGPSGEVIFENIVQGTYKLYELSAPEGYTVSQELANGMTIVVDESTTSNTRVIAARNELTQATLRKVNEDGQPLAGAIFRLEKRDSVTGTYLPYGTETYTSGANGVVRVTGLLPGRYRFVEVSPAPGYIANTQSPEFSLEMGSNGVIPPQNVGNYVNYRGRLRLVKTNEAGAPLAGAVFTLYNMSGGQVGAYTSGANGVVTINGIAPGTYLLRETKPPAGYSLVTDPRVITIPAIANGAPPVIDMGNIVNPVAVGGIVFHKIDGATGAALGGATFNLVSKRTGEIVASITTDATGMGSVDTIPVGEYQLVEVTPPAGYIHNTVPTDVIVEADENGNAKTVDIGVLNNYRGSLILTKTSNTGAPLQGAVFTLYTQAGDEIASYQTQADGTIAIYDLSPGLYILRETQAPGGYMLSERSFNITIPSDAPGDIEPIRVGPFVNDPSVGSMEFRKADGVTGAQLAGAVFEVVRKADGKTVATVTTNAMGDGLVENLSPGEYTLREIEAPIGYIRNTDTWDFSVVADARGHVDTVTLDDIQNYQGSVELSKTNAEGDPLEGATFSLFKTTGGVIGSYQTDAQGKITVDGLAPGTYRFVETHPPKGYTLNITPYEFTIAQEAPGREQTIQIQIGPIVNIRATGGMEFHKLDGDTGERLRGATFQVLDRETGDLVTTVIVNIMGIGRVSGLQVGDYRLVEVYPPAGYALNSIAVDFSITLDDVGTVASVDIGALENYRGKISLKKVDPNGNALAGAVFTLFNAAGTKIGDYQTGRDGVLEIYGLAPGEYLLRETRPPEGYMLVSDPFSITIPDSAEGPLPMLHIGPMANERAYGRVMFRKADAASGALLGGAQFQLTNLDTGDVVAVFMTDSTSQTVLDHLEPGAYRLEEIAAPAGYILNTTTWDFVVSPGIDGSIYPMDLGDLPNFQGSLKLVKNNEAGEPLAGAQFTLYRQSGGVVGVYETDADGIIEVAGLAPGTYRLRETRAPQGYTLVTDLFEFTIPQDAEGEPQVQDLGIIVDEEPEGSIILHKLDGDTGLHLQGAVFQLQDATGAEIARATTDADGIARFDGIEPGDYRLVELTPPPGYVRNTTVWEVTIAIGDDGALSPIDIGALDNYQGKIRLTKEDDTGNALAGATFLLTRADGTAVDTYQTDASGIIEIYGLAPGDYVLRETRAPQGYALAADPIAFTIPQETDEALPVLELGPAVNRKLTGSMTLRKVDEDTGTGLPGAVFQVISKATGEEVARVVTDGEGRGLVENLPEGEYSLVEVSAPSGYILRTEPWDFTIAADESGSIAPIDIGDLENGQGKIRLRKVDENGAALAGATFTLYRQDGAVVGTYQTDANGIVELYMLQPGTYRLVEASAPIGFELDGEPIEFTIPGTVERSMTVLELGPVVNRAAEGMLVIEKADAATGALLPGAVFRVIRLRDGAEVARVTTDSSGIAIIPGLEPGPYQIVELSPPTGYAANAAVTNVQVAEGQTTPIRVVIYNTRLPSSPTPTPSPRPTVSPEGPPQTGDMGNGPWIALLGLSAIAFLGAGLYLWHDRRIRRGRGGKG